MDDDRTLFECRCCGDSTGGFNDGTTDKPGWVFIARIDGPNHACPTCAADPDSLSGLAEDGYDWAHFVPIPVQSHA